MSVIITATINKASPRYQEWLDIFGTDQVPILGFLSYEGTALIVGKARFYELDLTCLTPEVRGKLVGFIARKFHIREEEVDAQIDEKGVRTIEQEFLDSVVMPNNSTVGEWVRPQMRLWLAQNRMPPLLPGGEEEAERG